MFFCASRTFSAERLAKLLAKVKSKAQQGLDGWKRAAFLAKPEKHFSATCVWPTPFTLRKALNGEWAANLFPRSPSPGFRSTDLALPLFPGRTLGKPQPSTNPEPSMPLAPATLNRSKKFSPTAAASLPTQPALHLRTDSAPPVLEIRDRRFPHAPALSQFVLVKRTPAWDRVSGWFQSRCSGVLKALPPSVLVNFARGFWRTSAGVLSLGSGAWRALTPSVLVKRVAPVEVHCPPVLDQRLGGQHWSGNVSGKRALGFGSAVAGEVRQARQSVLVKSFPGSCTSPPPSFCDPSARLTLNGWGVFRA